MSDNATPTPTAGPGEVVVEVIDLQDPACIQMMREFIQAHPKLWNEDIGK